MTTVSTIQTILTQKNWLKGTALVAGRNGRAPLQEKESDYQQIKP